MSIGKLHRGWRKAGPSGMRTVGRRIAHFILSAKACGMTRFVPTEKGKRS